jgi:hypothetical protein
MQRHVVQQKYTDVSEESTGSTLRAEEWANQEARLRCSIFQATVPEASQTELNLVKSLIISDTLPQRLDIVPVTMATVYIGKAAK